MARPRALLAGGSHATMTSMFAPAFFAIFLPAAVIGYAVVPKKWKKFFLLFVSCVFFWFVSGMLIVYLAATVLSVYLFGLWLNRVQAEMKKTLAETESGEKKKVKKLYVRRQRFIVFLAVLLHVGVLLLLKYSGFFAENLNLLLDRFKAPFVLSVPRFLAPVGISFFTLQALSYIFDVYRGVTPADRNLGRLALFICFFPQIVEGPICRYHQTAEKLWEARPITHHNLTFGLQRFLFGMMKKMVIADRLNPFVNEIFRNYGDYNGWIIALAAVGYTVQLYMDFSGSMDAVVGVAQIFGIDMPENFERPFFSRTISEFWKRWHITLGTWFRDYLFYPVTTAGRMKKLTSSARKKIGNHYGPLLAGSVALFLVWLCNGLWHGSGWNYIFFGMYHFVLILGGSLIAPVVKSFNHKLHINPGCFPYRVFQIIRTAVLVVIGELFFRADGLTNGLNMFRGIFSSFSVSLLSNDLLEKCLLDHQDFIMIGITLIIVFAVSVLNEKHISVRDTLAQRHAAIRWAVLYALILYIVIFGAYGYGYIPVDPLYAQF